MYYPIAKVDLTALRHNYHLLKEISANRPILAMVKANGYGHGIVQVAKALKQADFLGVARLSEAMQLRNAGVKGKIVLIEGFFDLEELQYCIDYSLDFVIHQNWQLDLLILTGLMAPSIDIWIKVDTGMNRLGFPPEDVQSVYTALKDQGCKNIKFITHFANADDISSEVTYKQKACFDDVLFKINKDADNSETSVANSAALLNFPVTRLGIVRAGIAIYGIDPSEKSDSQSLKAVMSLFSKVIAIRKCKAFSPVGYSGTWQSDHDTRLAVIAIGYGDGYPRHAMNGTPVFINNKKYSLVGRVSMDMITVDIGDDEINIGDSVELWGKNVSVTEVAANADTIPYQLLCGLTNRVQKEYIGN